MPTFKPPVYSKKLNAITSIQEPTYIFNILFGESDNKLIFTEEENSVPVSLKTLQECILNNIEWWNSFISDFLKSSSKHFAKPYSIDNINKIAKHTLTGNSEFVEVPYSVVFTPINIQISQGNFIVNWGFVVEPIIINIPDFEQSPDNIISNPLPDSKMNINPSLEELDINDIPIDKDLTGSELKMGNPAKHYDKQRVKEARLRAKLAIFKAERVMAKYYEKYGEDVSDIDSESESESDSDESYSNSELEHDINNQEVQL
jgi:hypothetical protein